MLWSWSFFWQNLINPDYGRAAWESLWAATVAEGGAVIVGIALALLARTSWPPLRIASATYVWLWRGTPLLVQLLLIYFGLPEIGIRLGVVLSAILTLIANEAAYIGVLVASSLRALPRGQHDASKAVGLTRFQTFLYVEYPQAIRTLVPILGNQFNTMIKTTSLLSIISFSELLQFTLNEVNQTYRPTEAFAVASLYYLTMTALWSGAQYLIERHYDVTRVRREPVLRRLLFAASH